KILQIARQFYPSVAGVERFVQDLSRHLIRRGHQVSVVTLNRCFYMDGVLPSEDVVEGVQVYRIPYWGQQRFFLAPSVLKFVGDYDLLHVHNIDFFLDFLSLTKWWHHKPIVLSTHGGFFHTKTLALLKKLYFNFMTRMTIRGAEVVLAVSEHDQELFSHITDKVLQINNGIDFSGFSDISKNPIPGLLVYVGRLASNKRVDNLIKALPFVRDKYSEARLVVVGADFEGIRSDLEELAGRLGVSSIVTFTGAVSREGLRECLARAHLFLSASEYEAFGISVLEAMASGTVPVVNDISPLRGFVRQDVTGFLTDFSKPEMAARVIVEALTLDHEVLRTIGKRAQEEARKYAWENVVLHFEQVYESVLSQSGGKRGTT
ncbi:MAG TPA: glycosyltransferase family 1 protein, partial [Anaerolineae bacterium]|nr:glycosyltransferase family 1 protein [Anaerolineae bacterium]